MLHEDIELYSERLVIRSVNPEVHAKEINRVFCSTIESLSKWLVFAKQKPTVDETRKRLEDDRKGKHKDAFYCAFIVYLHQQMIGMVYIMTKQQQSCNDVYELGYWIHHDYTCRGYATEAICRLIDFANEVFKPSKYIICCNGDNVASKKVAEKLGFSLAVQERKIFSARPDWGECTYMTFEKMIM